MRAPSSQTHPSSLLSPPLCLRCFLPPRRVRALAGWARNRGLRPGCARKTKQGLQPCAHVRRCALGTRCLLGSIAQVQGQNAHSFEGGVLPRRDQCQHSDDPLEWRDGRKTSYYWPSSFLASVSTEEQVRFKSCLPQARVKCLILSVCYRLEKELQN